MARNILPLLILFVINNSVLVPKLLMRNKNIHYWGWLILLLAFVYGVQTLIFLHTTHEMAPPGRPHPGPHPLLPLPFVLNFVYDLLVVGGNLVIALLFQRFYDRINEETKMKNEAENRLAYLKAQINPHFYLNMLNNIHGMIDINPLKAQEMLLDMSKLMRYSLYDSSSNFVALLSEINFLTNYINLMKLRFPEGKVNILTDFPESGDAAGVMVPPLIFLVFIENAFKHGISYRDNSFIFIRVKLQGKMIIFECENSLSESHDKGNRGIGLKNVVQRLDLIYGNAYTLECKKNKSTYKIILKINYDKTQDSNCG